jgi:hypothetical protein
MIVAAKGLLMANRLMPYALNLTPAPVTGGTPAAAGATPSGRTRAMDLQMCRVIEIRPVRQSCEVRVMNRCTLPQQFERAMHGFCHLALGDRRTI